MMNLTCLEPTQMTPPVTMVQRRMFPGSRKTPPDLRYAAASVAAGQIGGDFYDFLDLGPGSFGLLLADVCGKGLAAAIPMANLRASIRSECACGGSDYGAMFERVNARFFESTLPEQYATLFFAHYDELTHHVKYVNCGHPPAILVSRAGSIRRLKATAFPLGLLDDWDGECGTLDMQPGDSLFLYSDGVTEAGIQTGEEFGEQRLISFLQTRKSLDVESTVHGLIRAVRGYELGPQLDDITVAGLQCV